VHNLQKFSLAAASAGYADLLLKREDVNGERGRSENDSPFELMIIGAGSAGFAAAIRAAELGASVKLVWEGTIGGTCVNVGCIPSKTLVRSAAHYHLATRYQPRGNSNDRSDPMWSTVMEQKDRLVKRLRKTKYQDVLNAYPEISVIKGRARIIERTGVEIEGVVYNPDKIIIATGAHPRVPPISGLADIDYLDSTTAMSLKKLPRSMIVIGGGSVGLELAQTFERFGARVTLLESLPRILYKEEPDVSGSLMEYLTDEKMKIMTGVHIGQVSLKKGTYIVEALDQGDVKLMKSEQLLVATGRRANTEGLGLEDAGVTLGNHGEIIIDDYGQTSNPRIYAAGDCTGDPMLVYVAAYAGTMAAGNALMGNSESLDLYALPRVTFTDPQVASVGLTEEQARSAGHNVKVAVLTLEHVPRALTSADTRGLIKLVADRDTDLLLGTHVVAAEAGEVIQTAVIAMKSGYTTQKLASTIHPYLTMVEGLKLTAQTFEKDVATLSCCAG
jgi:mercuric reductase